MDLTGRCWIVLSFLIWHLYKAQVSNESSLQQNILSLSLPTALKATWMRTVISLSSICAVITDVAAQILEVIYFCQFSSIYMEVSVLSYAHGLGLFGINSETHFVW